MMSGPAPVFAATAAFGRTSSQLSLSTRTSMPYLAVNARDVLHVLVDVAWTSGSSRSTRSFAPFSGWLFHWACGVLHPDHRERRSRGDARSCLKQVSCVCCS